MIEPESPPERDQFLIVSTQRHIRDLRAQASSYEAKRVRLEDRIASITDGTLRDALRANLTHAQRRIRELKAQQEDATSLLARLFLTSLARSNGNRDASMIFTQDQIPRFESDTNPDEWRERVADVAEEYRFPGPLMIAVIETRMDLNLRRELNSAQVTCDQIVVVHEWLDHFGRHFTMTRYRETCQQSFETLQQGEESDQIFWDTLVSLHRKGWPDIFLSRDPDQFMRVILRFLSGIESGPEGQIMRYVKQHFFTDVMRIPDSMTVIGVSQHLLQFVKMARTLLWEELHGRVTSTYAWKFRACPFCASFQHPPESCPIATSTRCNLRNMLMMAESHFLPGEFNERDFELLRAVFPTTASLQESPCVTCLSWRHAQVICPEWLRITEAKLEAVLLRKRQERRGGNPLRGETTSDDIDVLANTSLTPRTATSAVFSWHLEAEPDPSTALPAQPEAAPRSVLPQVALPQVPFVDQEDSTSKN